MVFTKTKPLDKTTRAVSMEDADGASSAQHIVRRLAASDHSKGFLTLLSQLTTVGDISVEEFSQRFAEIESTQNSPYLIVVVEAEGRIVATGTLLIEKKFIHQCGSVGHIEDVVVDAQMRGHHLGQQIIEFLSEHARGAGCYKVILDCNEHNVKFYEKCGFSRKEIQLVKYFG